MQTASRRKLPRCAPYIVYLFFTLVVVISGLSGKLVNVNESKHRGQDRNKRGGGNRNISRSSRRRMLLVHSEMQRAHVNNRYLMTF